MSLIVKVLDNLTAIDHNGKDVTKKVPLPARKRASVHGTALRMVTTKTGKTQWRDTDIADYEALMKQAVTPKKAKADLRPISDVDIPAGAEVFCVPVKEGWGL